jgi:hypothetical protein
VSNSGKSIAAIEDCLFAIGGFDSRTLAVPPEIDVIVVTDGERILDTAVRGAVDSHPDW